MSNLPMLLSAAARALIGLAGVGLLIASAAPGGRLAREQSARNGPQLATPNAAHSKQAVLSLASTVASTEDPRVTLGRKLFFDARLSEPQGMSCATCHDPRQAYAGNNGSSTGTAQGSRPGHYARRNTPSVMYLRFVRRSHLVWEEEADRPEAFGGFFWDGRADSIASLVREPLLNPDEMGNRDLRQIADKVKTSSYAQELQREFDAVFASDDSTVEALSLCIEAFLTSRPMSPFSSKYDDFVRGRTALSAIEQRGLALFEDMDKGACSACHRLNPRDELPEASLFTDYGYDAIAVPRNRKLSTLRAAHDARRFDLGVCERRDPRLHTEDAWFCGTFRTPSLRNVAKRTSFMHNGYFSKLRDVVAFYATRASDPERWYGSSQQFDDLPAKYHDNINVTLPPYNQPKGEHPRLTEPDIDAILAFLETLSDRVVPRGP